MLKPIPIAPSSHIEAVSYHSHDLLQQRPEIPYGRCHCGCGQETKIALYNKTNKGYIKGEPIRFIRGHGSRLPIKRPPYFHQNKYRKKLQSQGLCLRCGKNKAGSTIFCEPCRLQNLAKLKAKYKPKIPALGYCIICFALIDKQRKRYCPEHQIVTLKCAECHIDFTVRRRGYKHRRYCSVTCRGEAQKKLLGPKSRNWQGGVTLLHRGERYSVEYKEWREFVFRRDDWTCQDCSVRGTLLHAHHIKEFSKYPELRFVPANGVTLCKSCHKRRHTKMKENNTNVESRRNRGEFPPQASLLRSNNDAIVHHVR